MQLTTTTSETDGANMPDISSLTSEIQNLEGWVNFWTKAGLVLGALTAAFGVLAAFATFASYWYGSRLKPLQDEVSRTKEAQIQTALSKQQERAANAERALLELQERVKPRWLTDEQRRLIIQEADTGFGQEITITCIRLNKESCDFAQHIANTLKMARWIVNGPEGEDAEYRGNPVNALFVYVRDDKSPPAGALILQRALDRAGLPSYIRERPEMPPEGVHLLVGVKP